MAAVQSGCHNVIRLRHYSIADSKWLALFRTLTKRVQKRINAPKLKEVSQKGIPRKHEYFSAESEAIRRAAVENMPIQKIVFVALQDLISLTGFRDADLTPTRRRANRC